MSKKSIIYIIIAVSAVALISGVALVLREKQEKVTVTEKPPTTAQETSQTANQTVKSPSSVKKKSDLISDWQSYANQKYGFRVKYPENWHIKEKPLPVYPDTFTVKVNFITPSAKEKFSISVRPKGDEGMIREAFSIISETKIRIDGFMGSKIVGAGQKDGSSLETFTLVKKGDYLYYLRGKGEVFDKMIASFEFMK